MEIVLFGGGEQLTINSTDHVLMGLFHKSEAVLFTWDYLSSYTQIHDFIKTLWEIK